MIGTLIVHMYKVFTCNYFSNIWWYKIVESMSDNYKRQLQSCIIQFWKHVIIRNFASYRPTACSEVLGSLHFSAWAGSWTSVSMFKMPIPRSRARFCACNSTQQATPTYMPSPSLATMKVIMDLKIMPHPPVSCPHFVSTIIICNTANKHNTMINYFSLTVINFISTELTKALRNTIIIM
jgi:hypothetical protein